MAGDRPGIAGSLSRLAAVLLIGAGPALAGWFIGQGFVESRLGPRSVAVKGLAEWEVEADLALWAFRFVANGNDLGEVRAKIAADEAAIRRFVGDAGLKDLTVEVSGFEVTDALAQLYRTGPVESRFIVAETLPASPTRSTA